jgi:hypothetical protein
MGVASLSCTPPDTDSARYHLEAAKDMMDKLLEDLDEEVQCVYVLRIVYCALEWSGVLWC